MPGDDGDIAGALEATEGSRDPVEEWERKAQRLRDQHLVDRLACRGVHGPGVRHVRRGVRCLRLGRLPVVVWNRRARKSAGNRINPPSAWVWSPEPVHPPIVSLGEYQSVAARAASIARSRRADIAAPSDGDTAKPRPSYLYRCGLCGQRMSGNARGTGRRYYSCFVHKQQPSKVPPGHPPTVNLPEPNLHDTLTQWLGHALFGPDRVDYWRQCSEPQPPRRMQTRSRFQNDSPSSTPRSPTSNGA